jgi:SAM-dependent methyltransferase
LQRLRQLAKTKARGLTDRVVRPYVEEILAAERAAPAPTPPEAPIEAPASGTTDFFHNLNHELRTMELERVPKGARRALSVGPQGRWYFDWFEGAVGPLESHIGIEAFEPQPHDLPAHVTWIPDTANHMDRVPDGAVDLVFAGQTTEHLWADELAGFLAEAHRVLGQGGLLVLDSPNRLVTEHLLWSHGGHTVELSAGEISSLVQLAGFDVESVRGLWRCAFEDRVLQLEEALDDAALVVRRIQEGGDRPDECFVWWIVARRAEREVDRVALDDAASRLYAQHWPMRVNRGIVTPSGPSVLPIGPDDAGSVAGTLPFPLHGGRWRLAMRLTAGQLDDRADVRIDISLPGDHVVHSLTLDRATRSADEVVWEFDQPELMFALQLRVFVDGLAGPAAISLPIDLRPAGQ